jgi:hypothetical protein
MELLIMLALIAAIAALILAPLVRPRTEEGSAGPSAGGEAPASRSRAALAAIGELEFDHATGKLADDDYRMLRSRYEVRAVDALTEPTATRPPAAPSTRIPAADDALEAEIRAARGRRFCTSCGEGLPAGARFCPACGGAVEVRA